MIWTKIKSYYILIFCPGRMPQFSQNLLIHQKSENDVLCFNVNMDVRPMSGNYAISRTRNFSASIFTHL